MSHPLHWGILGTGNIARQFAKGINASQRGKLVAVASRAKATAEPFATEFKVPTVYLNYQALLDDPSINAAYVSLPNSMHHEWTIKALRAGKHVLCEKPFADDAAQAEEMFDVAEKQGRVVMEAFMYRCHPLTLAVEKAVRQGAIGEVRMIRTSFCYRTTRVDGNVRFDPKLGGGILMDVGCYCTNFTRYFAQAEPTKVTASAHIHEKGVDDVVVGTMTFPNGVLGSFTCGMSVQADNTAYICGSEGYIEIPVPWKPPVQGGIYTVARSMPPKMDMGRSLPPSPREAISIDGGGDLYGNEADDFAASVLDGTPIRITRDDTVGNMRVLDELRRQIAEQ